jgi:SHS family sialic acid transporter-like MFS transporter
MSLDPNSARNEASPAGTGKWMALAAALLGWMFDGAEMGLFSLVGRAAVQDLLKQSTGKVPAEADVGFYFGVVIALFLVGAATGGVLFGWLGDRVGRVRAMSLSVITYAVFTGLCGFATDPLQIAGLRFIASLGMGGEWALGVALVMEVWPNKSRGLMAGLIGAAANVGYFVVAIVGYGLISVLKQFEELLRAVGLSEATAAWLVSNNGWRLLMILGTTPALLTFFFRLFVPESEKWKAEQGKGTVSNWATKDLLGVLVGAVGPALIVTVWALDGRTLGDGLVPARIVGSIVGLVIATAGYTYPVVRFLHRQRETDIAAGREPQSTAPVIRRMLLGAGLAGVALLGTWGSTQWAPAWASQLVEGIPAEARPKAKEFTLMASALGAIAGTLVAALVGDWLGRRITYFSLCVASFVSVLVFFQGNTEYGAKFLGTMFVAGFFTASFYGWLPLYLPELFRTSVRATGQGFGFNFGRILAAVGALQTGALMGLFKSDTGFVLGPFNLGSGYPAACSVMSAIYFVGAVLIWFAPETKGKPLPE